MRLVQFVLGTEIHPGVLAGDDHVVDLHAAAVAYPERLRLPVDSILSLLRQGDQALKDVRAIVDDLALAISARPQSIPEGVVLRKSRVTFVAPILNPQKIIGVGLNYRDHCEENNREPPRSLTTFAKYPSAIIGPEETIMLHPDDTQPVDYEAEFAVVIGKQARRLSEHRAMDCVAGYTIVNDVSARDIQFAEGQWVRAKSLDTFCPLGPAIVTKDEVPDPQSRHQMHPQRRCGLTFQHEAPALRCPIPGVVFDPKHNAVARRYHLHWHTRRGGILQEAAALSQAGRSCACGD